MRSEYEEVKEREQGGEEDSSLELGQSSAWEGSGLARRGAVSRKEAAKAGSHAVEVGETEWN